MTTHEDRSTGNLPTGSNDDNDDDDDDDVYLRGGGRETFLSYVRAITPRCEIQSHSVRTLVFRSERNLQRVGRISQTRRSYAYRRRGKLRRKVYMQFYVRFSNVFIEL